jgi:ribosomal-protein-alanine N-acetyltransferase
MRGEPPEVAVIAAGAPHSAAIADLHRRCFDEGWSRPTVRQVFAMPGAFGLLAVSGAGNGAEANPLGFALCRRAADECELLSLAVLPEWRGRGIGKALLAAAIARAREAGARRLFLEVAEDNVAAQRLYQAFRFRPVGRRPGYYRRLGAPAVAALTFALAFEG